MDNDDYFANIKGEYQEAVDYILEHSADSVERLKKCLDGILSGKVMDFGNGGVIVYDAAQLDRLICVDVINARGGRTEGKIDYIYGDFYAFDFPRDIDFVLAQFLLRQLPDEDRLAEALKSPSRSLGSRGSFIVVEVVMPRALELVKNFLSPGLFAVLRALGKPSLRFFSTSSLRRLLNEAGFDQLSIHPIDVSGWTAPAPALFPRLRLPTWLYPMKCIVIEARSREF